MAEQVRSEGVGRAATTSLHQFICGKGAKGKNSLIKQFLGVGGGGWCFFGERDKPQGINPLLKSEYQEVEMKKSK